jgi:hypothetical protein
VSSIRSSPLRVPKTTKIRKINEFLTTRISLPHLADHSYPFAHNQPKLRISAHHLLRPLSAVSYKLQATGYRLQATGYKLPATGNSLLISPYGA